MGGSSSDRAIELAQALNEQLDWKGARPQLFITTATAQADIDPVTREGPELIQIYPGRTFRGCFTNTAMARAVIDFVWRQADLRPTGSLHAYVAAWQDDPYSLDLAEQFGRVLRERTIDGRPVETTYDPITYSVATFTEPNPPERQVLNRVLADLDRNPGDRSLLVLPAATQPARRTLRALAADSPLIGKDRLVAVTGDGVSFNTMYRDGDVAWPVQELSVPLVFFAHQDPVRWDPPATAGDPTTLHPPTATDDVLLFADMVEVAARALYLGERVTDADKFGQKLRAASPREGAPRFYGPDGERPTGQGEYVVVVRPQFDGGRVLKDAVLDVYTRKAGQWERVRRLDRAGPDR
jgi:hypothetical protein